MKVTPKKTETVPAVDEFLAVDDTDASTPETDEEEFVDPLDILAEQFPDAPARRTIEGWKEIYGAVYAFVPDQTTLFLLRPLRRIEHKNIAKEIRILAEGPAGREDPSIIEEQLHEKVVNLCMMYPAMTPQFLTMSPAGLMPTLFNLVMEHSKFISPDAARNSTFKL